MAVSIVLDLTDEVSTNILRQFLSFIPEGFDPGEDLRACGFSDATKDVPHFLQILLPFAAGQEQQTPVRTVANNIRRKITPG